MIPIDRAAYFQHSRNHQASSSVLFKESTRKGGKNIKERARERKYGREGRGLDEESNAARPGVGLGILQERRRFVHLLFLYLFYHPPPRRRRRQDHRFPPLLVAYGEKPHSSRETGASCNPGQRTRRTREKTCSSSSSSSSRRRGSGKDGDGRKIYRHVVGTLGVF